MRTYEGSNGLTIQNDDMPEEQFLAFLIAAFSRMHEVMKPGTPFYIWHAETVGGAFRRATNEALGKVRQMLIWNKNAFTMGHQDYQWKHEACMQIIASLIMGIAEALPTLIPQIVEVVVQMVQTLIDNLPLILDAALQLIEGLAQGILDAIPVLIEALPEVIMGIVNFLLDSIPEIIDTGIKLLTSLIDALPTIIQTIVAAIPQIINGIINAVLGAIPQIIQAGIQLLISLIQALPQIITTIVAAIPEIISGMPPACSSFVVGQTQARRRSIPSSRAIRSGALQRSSSAADIAIPKV